LVMNEAGPMPAEAGTDGAKAPVTRTTATARNEFRNIAATLNCSVAQI
jgi:hypothetical protein